MDKSAGSADQVLTLSAREQLLIDRLNSLNRRMEWWVWQWRVGSYPGKDLDIVALHLYFLKRRESELHKELLEVASLPEFRVRFGDEDFFCTVFAPDEDLAWQKFSKEYVGSSKPARGDFRITRHG